MHQPEMTLASKVMDKAYKDAKARANRKANKDQAPRQEASRALWGVTQGAELCVSITICQSALTPQPEDPVEKAGTCVLKPTVSNRMHFVLRTRTSWRSPQTDLAKLCKVSQRMIQS